MAIFLGGCLTLAGQKAADWPVWGGPNRDFKANVTGLADTWPKDGPRKLWSRPLGDGYSAVAVENGVLYTMYRRGDQDVAIAMDAATGQTRWEHAYPQPFRNAGGGEIGPGPYAMPQVIGDRVFTAGGRGAMHCLDKRSGKVLWQHDLYKEYSGTVVGFGYSCQALPYNDNVVMLVGGSGSSFLSGLMSGGNAFMAFKQSDGTPAWHGGSFRNAHSSPLLIKVDGQDQIVGLTAGEVSAVDPGSGKVLWTHKHPTEHGLAVSTPVWGPGNRLFVSSAYNGGSRVLELHQAGGKTTVNELWHVPRIQTHFTSAIWIGDHIYVSSGQSAAFLMAVEAKTGRIAWQSREFAKAQLLYADGKLIVLDQDGNLGLVQPSPVELKLLAKVPMLQAISWTPPTLAGATLYVRDRKNLMALDLGKAATPSAPKPAPAKKRPAAKS